MKCKSRNLSVVYFQDLNCGLGNVSEALQRRIGDSFAKNESVARFGKFLKRDDGAWVMLLSTQVKEVS